MIHAPAEAERSTNTAAADKPCRRDKLRQWEAAAAAEHARGGLLHFISQENAKQFPVI